MTGSDLGAAAGSWMLEQGHEEKAELWPQILRRYKGYDGYQRRSPRDIPIVICTPAD